MSESNICLDNYECGGMCYLNLRSEYIQAWEVISAKCSGSIEEKEINDNFTNGTNDIEPLLTKYNLNEDELLKVNTINAYLIAKI